MQPLWDRLYRELYHWDTYVQTHPQDARGYVRRGMSHFKLAQIQPAIQDFDRAEQLDERLTPHLWQRGLAYYYANRFADGAWQFEQDLTVNGHDGEEILWRFLCQVQSGKQTDSSGAEAFPDGSGAALPYLTMARQALIPLGADPRPVMTAVYGLYAGQQTPDDLLRAGERLGRQGQFYSYLYLGLYYEVLDDESAARQSIAIAVDGYPLEDYMWYLANVHQRLRHWASPEAL